MKDHSRNRLWRRGLVIGALIGAGSVGARKMKQKRDRASHSDALAGSISISYTKHRVPRIVAANRDDALFGLGYAVAGDRLWQLDIHRRSAYGELCEVFGEQMLQADRLMRAVGVRRIAHQLERHLDEDTRSAAKAFSAGVNHRIETGRLPFEFKALRYKPAPWTVADSLAVYRLLAWSLGGSIDTEITGEWLREVLGDEWTDAIYFGSYPEQPPIVREAEREVMGAPLPADRLPLFPGWGMSNAWAVSADRSETGAPLLANDPHLELSNPSIWYEASIEAPGFRVAGVTMPGVPAILIGRTPALAWGATAGMAPQKFLYRERLSEDRTQVADDDDWTPIQIHDEILSVRGAGQETLRLRHTPRGVLISDVLSGFADDEAVSFHWTGMERSNELAALLAANAGGSIDDLRGRMDEFCVPSLNLVAADNHDNIAMVSVGRIALRERYVGYLAPEVFPPWYIDPADMPVEMNPERGWVACANNCVVGDDFPYPVHGHWMPGFRYTRISEGLERRRKHSPADMRKLQLDNVSVHARRIVPALLDLLEGSDLPGWIIDDLREWNGSTPSESRPTLLFEAFFREWMRLAVGGWLPEPVATRLSGQGSAFPVPQLFADRLLLGEIPAWFEQFESPTARWDMAVEAMRRAIDWIAIQLGENHEHWTWGAVHQLTFTHPLGMVEGPHQHLVNVGPFPTGGTGTTVSPFAWQGDEDFKAFAGPSMRFVADMRDPAESWIAVPPGQSGSPFRRTYRDQAEHYFYGAAHRLWPDGSEEQKVIIEPA